MEFSSRIQWISGAAVACALIVGAATDAASQDAVVYAGLGGSTQDAVRSALLQPISESMGIEIKEETHNWLSSVRLQVQSNAVVWDIVELSIEECAFGEEQGLFEPLDYNVIDTEGISEQYYSDTWIGGSVSSAAVLAWNTNSYPDNPPSHMNDLFDLETYPGRRSVAAWPQDSMETALIADGVASEDLVPLDVDRAFAKLDQIRDSIEVFYETGAQQIQLLSDGEVDMLIGWNGRVQTAKEQGAPIDFTYDGAIGWRLCLAIPKGAPNAELAQKVIAAMVSSEFQQNIPEHTILGPVNEMVWQSGKVSEEQMSLIGLSPMNADRHSFIVNKEYLEWYSQNLPAIQERWDTYVLN